MKVGGRLSWVFGLGLLVVAFLVFLFYGNVAIGVVFLALGIIFVVKGNWRGSRPS